MRILSSYSTHPPNPPLLTSNHPALYLDGTSNTALLLISNILYHSTTTPIHV